MQFQVKQILSLCNIMQIQWLNLKKMTKNVGPVDTEHKNIFRRVKIFSADYKFYASSF